jgi:hypothetical protein
VQNIIVVKSHLARLQRNPNLTRQFIVRACIALSLRASAAVAAGHQDEGGVTVKSHVPLCVESGFAQTSELFVRAGGGWDVVAVPSEFEVCVWPDEEVVEFHYQVLVSAIRAEEFADGGESCGGEVRFGEEFVAWEGGVHELLHAPDSERWVGGPGWELAWESSDVWPFAFAGKGGDVVGGGSEGFDLGRGEVGGDDYEAVAFQRGLEVLGWSRRHA